MCDTPPAASLRGLISICGIANLLVLVAMIPLSYALTVVVPFGEPQPNALMVFKQATDSVRGVAPTIADVMKKYLSEDSPLSRSGAARLLLGSLPLAISTVVALIALFALRRGFSAIDEDVVTMLLKFSMLFALASFFIYPVFAKDLWTYVVYARMLADGHNPYYSHWTSTDVVGLPFDEPVVMSMSYGPLWAILSRSIAFISCNGAVQFVLFKLVIGLCWVLSLLLVRGVLRQSSVGHRAVAILLFGWLPVSAYLAIGEGHNDSTMVLLLLVWIYLVSTNKHLYSPFALAASSLVKYGVAPLWLLEVAHAWSNRRMPRGKYLIVLAVVGLFIVAAFLPFWQGPSFFSALSEVRGGHYFSPTHAVYSLARMLRLPVPWSWAQFAVYVVLIAVILWHVDRYRRRPDLAAFASLILAVLGSTLLSSSHFWPWYVLWLLAPAAIAARSGLLRIVVPFAVFAPFILAPTLVAAATPRVRAETTLALYALVLAGALLMPKDGLFPPTSSARPAGP